MAAKSSGDSWRLWAQPSAARPASAGSCRATVAANCFALDGLFAAPGFELTVERRGFKSIRSTHRMGRYTVDVILASVDSVASSRMVFHELPADAPQRDCSDGPPP